MSTIVLPVNPLNPEPEVIARAAEVIRAGGLVAFPTETVYGLGANALDADAVRGIFEAKGRPANNPVIVHIADLESIHQLTDSLPELARKLAARFWPGPLSLVLPRRENVPTIVAAGGPTVAVRMPAHPVALALIAAAGVPIAAPSANRSTELSPTRAEHVLRGLDGRIDVLLDGGSCPGGIESTVLDVTVSPPRLLRPGLVTPADIESVIGPIVRPEASGGRQPSESSRSTQGADAPRSPGMMTRHYAPRTSMELAADDGRSRVEELLRERRRVGWLTFSEENREGLTAIVMPCHPKGYAAALYAALHQLDEKGLDRIVAARPPEGDDWLAARDRLRRAASPPVTSAE